MDTIRPELFFLGLGVLWIGVTVLIARLSGWATLADVYRFSEHFNGYRWRFQRAQMRWGMSYNGLTVGMNEKGLYLSVFFLFRMGHPPLFIPWRDISVSVKQGLLGSYMEFRFRRALFVPFWVTEGLGRGIARLAGDAWPGEHPDRMAAKGS